MKLLCDAVIVIEAHRLKIWQYLQNRHKIFISSGVKDECIHYFSQGEKQFIDMEKDIKRGSIKILTGSTQAVSDIIKKLDKYNLDIHTGEAESIALMLNSKFPELNFCTADKAAIKALYLFNLSHRVVSLEKCLEKSMKVRLPEKCTEDTLKRYKNEALQYFGIKRE